MAELGTVADGIRFYHTGADADACSERDADASLGGFRALEQHEDLVFRRVNALPGLVIEYVAGENAAGATGVVVGSGSLTGEGGDLVTWTPPGGSPGAAVSVPAGTTKLVEGGTNADKFVRVRRTGAADLEGIETVVLAEAFNNVVGLDDVSSAEALAGTENYRALMARVESAVVVQNVSVWLRPFETAAVTDTAQLGPTGAGTLGSTAGYQNWAKRGFGRIRTGGTALAELVYYDSRTDSVLNVPAWGRGLGGTTAAAGGATDTVEPVPGLRIASETPAGGAIQTIANDTIAPAGRTWNTGLTAAEGLSLGTLAASAMFGLWFERIVPAGMVGDAFMPVAVGYSFDIYAVTYTGTLRGVYRVANDGLVRFEVWVGDGALPDLSAAPDATSPTLPFNVALPAAQESHVIFRQRNAYDLLDSNLDVTIYDVAAGGALNAAPPRAPEHVEATAVTGGAVDVVATYIPAIDGVNRADTWVIYEKDGADPDPAVDPELQTVAMWVQTDNVDVLTFRSAPFLDGTDTRWLVRTRRSGTPDVDSTNTAAVAVVVDSIGPSRPAGSALLDDIAGFRQGAYAAPGASDAYIVSTSPDIKLVPGSGTVSFLADGALIWRAIADACGTSTAGLWFPRDWVFQQLIGSLGAGSSAAIEVVSWTAPDKRLSVNVAGQREMEIDVTNKVVRFGVRKETGLGTITAMSPVWPRATEVRFQIWDPSTGDWQSYMLVDSTGVWRLGIARKESKTEAEILAL